MKLRTFLKPFSFIPAVLIMYMIFSFSSQNGETSSSLSYKVSYQIIKTADYILDAGLEEWQMEDYAVRYNHVTRKIAHMGEYFLLAISVSFPLYVYGMHGLLLVLVSGFFCVSFACTDEYHQAFIYGRSPSGKDVIIDSVGILIGIILVRIIGFIGRKTIFRPVHKNAKSRLSSTENRQTGNEFMATNSVKRTQNNYEEDDFISRSNDQRFTDDDFISRSGNQRFVNDDFISRSGNQRFVNDDFDPDDSDSSDDLSSDMPLSHLIHRR